MNDTTDELLARLLVLSELDQRIRQLKERIERAPASVAEKEKAADELEAKAATLRQKLAVLRAQRKLRENEVKGFDTKLARLKTQSTEVRTNKEFVAFKSEIANTQAESDRLQNEVLKILDVEEQADTRIRQLEERRDAERAEAAALKARTLEQMGAVRAELESVEAERKRAVDGLPREALGAYERVRVARGSGMAVLEGEYCGGCGALMTRNDVYAVQNRSRLVPCKSCNRILYLTRA